MSRAPWLLNHKFCETGLYRRDSVKKRIKQSVEKKEVVEVLKECFSVNMICAVL